MNELSQLDVSHMDMFEYTLDCLYNELVTLTVGIAGVIKIDCSHNNLIILDLKYVKY